MFPTSTAAALSNHFNATAKQQRNHLLLRDEDQFWMDNTSNTQSNPASVTNGSKQQQKQLNAMKNKWAEEKPN